MKDKYIEIAGVRIGDSYQPAIIAELGNCYEESVDVAFEIIRAAKERVELAAANTRLQAKQITRMSQGDDSLGV